LFIDLSSRKRQRHRSVRQYRQQRWAGEHRQNPTGSGRRVPTPAELGHGNRPRQDTSGPEDCVDKMQHSEFGRNHFSPKVYLFHPNETKYVVMTTDFKIGTDLIGINYISYAGKLKYYFVGAYLI